MSSRSSGENWDAAEFDLAADTPGTSGFLVQFQSASPLVEAAVAEVAPEDMSGRVRFADAIVTLTLSGDDCWSGSVGQRKSRPPLSCSPAIPAATSTQDRRSGRTPAT
jgi:hypothetical protein